MELRNIVLIAFALVFCFTLGASTQEPAKPIGIFSDHRDISGMKLAGDCTYDSETGIYTIKAGGNHLKQSQGHIATLEISGDCLIKAHVRFLQRAHEYSFAYIGFQDDSSEFKPITVFAGIYTEINETETIAGQLFYYRYLTNGNISYYRPSDSEFTEMAPDGRYEIVREGTTFSLYYFDSLSGERILFRTVRNIHFNGPVSAMIGVTSQESSKYCIVEFRDVEIKPLNEYTSVHVWSLY